MQPGTPSFGLPRVASYTFGGGESHKKHPHLEIAGGDLMLEEALWKVNYENTREQDTWQCNGNVPSASCFIVLFR